MNRKIEKSDANSIGGCIRAEPQFLSFVELFDENDISTKIQSKYFLIKYSYSANREDEFCNFLLNNMINYALKKAERNSYVEETDAQKRVRVSRFREIYLEAVRRYVANSKKFKGGEIGELILFHVLEVVEHAVQVINKMSMKTSDDMYYHGADAVHFGIKNGIKILYFGESKTGFDFSQTLSDSLKSVNTFTESSKQKKEIELVKGNLSDDLSDEIKGVIKKYLNPEEGDLTDFTHTYAILLAFNKKELLELERRDLKGQELFDSVRVIYRQKIIEYETKIIEKFDDYPELKNKLFVFYLIPFKDLKKIRKTVLEEINRAK